MNHILNISEKQPLTMSSLDFLNKIINPIRFRFGESEVKNAHFIKRVEDELDDLGAVKTFNRFGNEVRFYMLNAEQMMLVGMRESKAVRKAVLEKLKELESQQSPKIPQTYSEALQLAADQAKALELAKPKVEYFDRVVERTNLLNASQVGQKVGLSAIKLNRCLDAMSVYHRGIKRGRVFQQWFVDKGYGELKQTELGYPQAMFTPAGEAWVVNKIVSEGIV